MSNLRDKNIHTSSHALTGLQLVFVTVTETAAET